MKYFITLIFIVSALPANALADLASIDPKELIKESDLIVVGTLTNVSTYTEDGIDYSQGVITIRQLIAGSARTLGGRRVWPDDSIIVKWEKPAHFACLAGMHGSAENIEGGWLLTIEKETARADRPGSFIPSERFAEIMRLLNSGTYVKNTEKQIKVLSEKSAFEDKMAAISLANHERRRSGGEHSLYSPYRALLVFMASVIVYMILYRNRFK